MVRPGATLVQSTFVAVNGPVVDTPVTVRLLAAPEFVTLTVCVRGSPIRRVPKSVGPSIVAVVRFTAIARWPRRNTVVVPPGLTFVTRFSEAFRCALSSGASCGEKPTWMTHDPPAPTGLPAQPLFRIENDVAFAPVSVALVTFRKPPPVLVTVMSRAAGAAPEATVPKRSGAVAVVVPGLTDRAGVPAPTPVIERSSNTLHTPFASTPLQKRSVSMFHSVSTPSGPPW